MQDTDALALKPGTIVYCKCPTNPSADVPAPFEATSRHACFNYEEIACEAELRARAPASSRAAAGEYHGAIEFSAAVC